MFSIGPNISLCIGEKFKIGELTKDTYLIRERRDILDQDEMASAKTVGGRTIHAGTQTHR